MPIRSAESSASQSAVPLSAPVRRSPRSHSTSIATPMAAPKLSPNTEASLITIIDHIQVGCFKITAWGPSGLNSHRPLLVGDCMALPSILVEAYWQVSPFSSAANSGCIQVVNLNACLCSVVGTTWGPGQENRLEAPDVAFFRTVDMADTSRWRRLPALGI